MPKAIILLDLKGFSRLPPEGQAAVFAEFLPMVHELLVKEEVEVVDANTWGDSVLAVVENVGKAASVALSIKTEVQRRRWKEKTLTGLGVRIAIHVADLRTGTDAVRQMSKSGSHVYGKALVIPARIEPVVPADNIYVTAEAAPHVRAAIDEGSELRTDTQLVPLGMVKLAKQYGELELFWIGEKDATPPKLDCLALSTLKDPSAVHFAPDGSQVIDANAGELAVPRATSGQPGDHPTSATAGWRPSHVLPVPSSREPDNHDLEISTRTLSRLHSLRAINEYVEKFHIFAASCRSARELEEASKSFHMSILRTLRFTEGQSQDQGLEADVLAAVTEGQVVHFDLVFPSTAESHARLVPKMQLVYGPSRQLLEPQAGDGIAPYAYWAAVQIGSGVALARDVHKSADIEYWKREIKEPKGVYRPVKKEGIYAPARGTDSPPYRTVLSTIIQLTKKASGKPSDVASWDCFGLLNITSKKPDAFAVQDFAWAEAAASLIGSFYQSYLCSSKRIVKTLRNRNGSGKRNKKTGGRTRP
ncbi:MAG: hypothetical protein HY898_30595 [Deltaproteobacteria bacterium]|nr:hypothetical protein [Deltaproteobacteria bacterium]